MFWIGLTVGMFVGTAIGVLVVAMCVAANKEYKVPEEGNYGQD